LAHWAIKNTPLILGTLTSLYLAPALAIFAIPWVTMAMAGGWNVFMGLNIFKEFNIYHREQRNSHKLPPPNPNPIKKNEADTWRNTLREAFGIKPPIFSEEEFTSNNDPAVDPYQLWPQLASILGLPTAANDNPLLKINNDVIGTVSDLYGKLKANLKFPYKNPLSWPRAAVLHRLQIAKLAFLTRKDRVKKMDELDAEQYDRIRELNRIIIEETFSQNTPKRGALLR
jgi:hypothetical protein